MSLPLSLDIVGTDRSLRDNDGAIREWWWWAGNKKRKL